MGERIGDGGTGAVFKAHHTILDRTVAVKLLRPELDGDAHALRKFQLEGFAASRVSHRNSVRIVDFGVCVEGGPFLVMEHIAGEPLAAAIRREGPLALPRASSLVSQLLAALGEAHRCGITHADVTSDHVLVATLADGEDVATLTNFGLARVHDSSLSRAHDPAAWRGTPSYLAPELVAGGSPTPQSDLYAAAVVLYEALTGAPPFAGSDTTAVMHRHLSQPVVPPSLRRPDGQISPWLDQVVVRALAKDPAKRYASARELADAVLDATASGLDTHPPRASSPATGRARAEAVAALAAGDTDAVTRAYLALAHTLLDDHQPAVALRELDAGIAVLTCARGSDGATPPSLWRLLLGSAMIRDGLGDARRARADGEDALAHAMRAGSRIGCGRASRLLVRLRRCYPSGSSM